jgi:glycosyltransferase involved in cell wall biosynthesis
MPPTVSIILNCYNQEHCLERSVRSVLDQTFTDLECIIVDDGSTDGTQQVAERLVQTDARLRYCRKENGGLPAARNYGVQQAQGEWIQCLDGDDWIHPDKTRFQLDYFGQLQQSPENVVLYCDYQRVYLESGLSKSPGDKAEDRIVERQDHVIGELTTEALIPRLLTPDFLCDTPHPALQQAMLMHRSIFEQHRFPEHLKALGDRFFAVDILAQGIQFVYTPLVGAFYTKHRGNRTNKWPYMRNYYILFYETVHAHYPERMPQCQAGMSLLLDEAIREDHRHDLQRLRRIAAYPMHLLDGKLRIDSGLFLSLFRALRLSLPRFVFYQKYRGPRSQRLFRLASKLKPAAFNARESYENS